MPNFYVRVIENDESIAYVSYCDYEVHEELDSIKNCIFITFVVFEIPDLDKSPDELLAELFRGKMDFYTPLQLWTKRKPIYNIIADRDLQDSPENM